MHEPQKIVLYLQVKQPLWSLFSMWLDVLDGILCECDFVFVVCLARWGCRTLSRRLVLGGDQDMGNIKPFIVCVDDVVFESTIPLAAQEQRCVVRSKRCGLGPRLENPTTGCAIVVRY